MKHEFISKLQNLLIGYIETMPSVYHIQISTPVQWIVLRHFLKVSNISHTELTGDGRAVITL